MTSGWSLSQAERDGVIEQTAKGISSLCFFGNHGEVSADAADAAAQKIEKSSYNRAQVESQTTTGARPRIETERAYFRILSQAVMECVKNGCSDVSAGTTQVTGFLDLSQSGREFMTADLAKELFGQLLIAGAQLSGMKLSTKSIGRDAAPIVAEAIRNVAGTLKIADISDIIAGRPEAEVLNALTTVSDALSTCTLDELNVSDNALGEKGIRACAAAFTSQKTLKGVYLQNIGCSVNACKAVNELIASTSLETLHLFNNMSDNEGAISIAALLQRNPSIRDFKMVSSRVGPAGGLALMEALSHGSKLQSLNLTDNPITMGFASGLPAMFAAQSSLTRLAFNDICLQDEGMVALAAALRSAPAAATLETVELALNEITSASSKQLAVALASMPRLRTVILSENELGDAGACHVAVGLAGASCLEVLDLRTNEIGRVGATVVARCCATGKPGMLKLELNDNQISEAGVTMVTELLEEAFPGKPVLGELDENDEENDPEDPDAEDQMEDLDLDLSKMNM